MKVLSKIYMALVFLLLYAPILVVIVFSFNEGESLSVFSGFSFHWYGELFEDAEALTALRNSLILAVVSSVLATVLGVLAAFAIDRAKQKWWARTMQSASNIPMMNPDIVTGVSMMLLFVGIAALLKTQPFLGVWTMIAAHTTFNLPYVILSVLPKFREMDRSLSEAALDLGCTPARTFFRVELPCILPGAISGMMMSFALSLDDFVISHFVSSPDFRTLPLYIYNQTVHDVKFSMYALCTLIVFAVLGVLIAVNVTGAVRDGKKHGKKGGARS